MDFDPFADYPMTFDYQGKTYDVAEIESVGWSGRKTLDAMENAKTWRIKYAGKTVKMIPDLIEGDGVYFLKEIAFPG